MSGQDKIDQRLDSWLATSLEAIDRAPKGPVTDDIGRVEQVADGIALVSGLPHLGLHELMRTENGQYGFALTLDPDQIGCVLLDANAGIDAGMAIRGTGDVVRTRVGEGLLGRIVDPLGRPLDGKGPIADTMPMPIEQPAPPVIERDLITQQVITGILGIDAMFPLGRGQRELIVGDRATGKTAIAVDTIISQRQSDMICIYVAIGQKAVGVRRVVDAISRYGAMDRCIIVVAGAATAPGLQWIAPFAGFTMAEYFRDRGQHALVVLDDLSKHAATHRELALLTRQPPGREAYPGDIFYLHARLLERSAKLSPEKGGGSLTALPIVETDAGNLSGYIPTNIISITDGQLVLDTKLFDEGQKPAIDIGRSVSRVGGKTQVASLRQWADTLRLDYAQFLELEIFTRLGGAAEAHVRATLERGRRTKRLLAQPQYEPHNVLEQLALLRCLRTGLLDQVKLEAIGGLRAAMRKALAPLQESFETRLRQGARLDAADEASLDAALREAVAAISAS